MAPGLGEMAVDTTAAAQRHVDVDNLAVVGQLQKFREPEPPGRGIEPLERVTAERQHLEDEAAIGVAVGGIEE